MLSWTSAAQTAVAAECDVQFEFSPLEGDRLVEAYLDYSAAQGTFVGTRGKVKCRVSETTSSLVAYDACDKQDHYCHRGDGRTLALILQPASAFDGDHTQRVSCDFTTTSVRQPTPSDFVFVTSWAFDRSGKNASQAAREGSSQVTAILCENP